MIVNSIIAVVSILFGLVVGWIGTVMGDPEGGTVGPIDMWRGLLIGVMMGSGLWVGLSVAAKMIELTFFGQ